MEARERPGDTHGTSIEARILARPHDPVPRHEYADWCEGHDPPRGEFIRAQFREIELRGAGDSGWHVPRQRAAALLRNHGGEWPGPIAKRVSAYTFSRGFVEHVELDARAFLDQAADLYALAPIRHLTLTGVRDVSAELFESAHLERIVSLCISQDGLDDAGLARLAASPRLGRLAHLDIGFNAVTREGYTPLVSSTTLPSLAYVNSVGNPGGDLGETYGTDWMDGSLHGIRLPHWVSLLEERHGRRRFLHIIEELGRIPSRFEF